jgi:GntR family transcriptional regulator
VKPVVAQQSIGARMPSALERRQLEIRGSQPVLTMARMAFDASGNAVEFGDHSYRASDYTIDLMVDER